MHKDTWVVVSNSSCARIFHLEKNRTLKELELIEHPESRLHERDLVSSKPGRAFDSMGRSRHSMEQQSSPKQQEFTFFAKYLSDHLETARKNGSFGHLYLIASPAFLGILRQVLNHQTVELIKKEVDKDMTQLTAGEIEAHLAAL